jgi:hypothetical protein
MKRKEHVAACKAEVAHLPWACRIVALADFVTPQGENPARRKAFEWAIRQYPWDEEADPWPHIGR